MVLSSGFTMHTRSRVALSEFAYPVDDVAEMQKNAALELERLKEVTMHKLNRPVVIHTKTEMNVLSSD
jgi:hypothetical protein